MEHGRGGVNNAKCFSKLFNDKVLVFQFQTASNPKQSMNSVSRKVLSAMEESQDEIQQVRRTMRTASVRPGAATAQSFCRCRRKYCQTMKELVFKDGDKAFARRIDGTIVLYFARHCVPLPR